MWLTTIRNNWRLILAGLASLLILSLYGWGSHHARRADQAVWNLSEYKRLADVAMKTEKDNNERANDEIRQAIPRMVEQAEKNAYANYLARFGRGNAACGVGPRSVLPTAGTGGTDDRAERPDAASGEQLAPEREFVEACARDAGRLNLWIKRCELSPNICKVDD